MNEVSRETRERAADILCDAAELVQKGWIQGCSRSGDSYCAIGAIDYAGFAFPASQYLAKNTLREVIGDSSIACWNDHHSRTQEEVVAAMKKAADHLRNV